MKKTKRLGLKTALFTVKIQSLTLKTSRLTVKVKSLTVKTARLALDCHIGLTLLAHDFGQCIVKAFSNVLIGAQCLGVALSCIQGICLLSQFAKGLFGVSGLCLT